MISAPLGRNRGVQCSDVDPGLRVGLESHLPASLPIGRPTAVFCFGHCFHRRRAISDLALMVDGVRHRPTASRMPRRDLFEWLHRSRGEDPEGRSYRSGFWVTLPIPARDRPGFVELSAEVRVGGSPPEQVALGRIEIAQQQVRKWPGGALDPGTIAICMATYQPDLSLFRTQVESLRAQTDGRWICVISDDGSERARVDQMMAIIGDDPRFELVPSQDRIGPYGNFERALTMAPADAELLAPCDQDDRWYPDKLAVLRAAIGSSTLVYCDQRLVGADGTVLRDSLWKGRRNEYTNLASLLVANAVPGAAMLLRREVAGLAVPFPDAPGIQYHDHWLALVALASGDIGYVEQPLYDYVQHGSAVSGDLAEAEGPVSIAGSRGLRGAYFGGYLAREVQAQTLLLRCAPTLTPRKRRALQWLIGSARSPAKFLWLSGRPLRRLLGRDETLGGELALAKGIMWRWLLTVAVGRAELPGGRPFDASFPDPPRFEQPRLRRWRAGI